jgi:rubredoxin
VRSPIRRFKEAGVDAFRSFLDHARENPDQEPPWELLDDASMTETLGSKSVLGRQGFKTKREAASYLLPRLKAAVPGDLMADAGLWTWLALYYFDDICPPDGLVREVGADARYIYDPQNGRRRYRHLLATPVSIFQAIPDYNRLILDAPLDTHGDLLEQFLGRLYLFRVPSVRELAERLYYDEDQGQPKPGISPKKPRPGDLRNRLPVRIQQLQLTYDLAELSADRLLELLGDEFQSWAR